jgi:alkylhydroperoxidase family enzyme
MPKFFSQGFRVKMHPMTARIAAIEPPYTAELQAIFDRMMPPGVPPLTLFTTLASDRRLFDRFRRGGLLDKGHLTLHQREIVIDRTTALSGSEYEWGVHIAFFADRADLNEAQRRSLVRGTSNDPCWSPEDRVLLQACDQLHATCDLDDALWTELSRMFSDTAIIEIVMLAGFYRTVSYLTNALRLPFEHYAARFPV